MNGRVYDYNVGRFLSVDPFIHGGSQGINPYSYIMNNPLAGTDPSGYKPKCDVGGEACSDDEQPKKEKREVTGDEIVLVDDKGNHYIDAGDDSGDLIKVDEYSNGANTNDSGNKSSENIGSMSSTNKVGINSGTADSESSITMNARHLDGASAQYGEIVTSDDDVITNATINCNLSCQEESLDILKGRDLAQADLAWTLMRTNIQSAQVQGYTAVAVASLPVAAAVAIPEAAAITIVRSASWVYSRKAAIGKACKAASFAALCSLGNDGGKVKIEWPTKASGWARARAEQRQNRVDEKLRQVGSRREINKKGG